MRGPPAVAEQWHCVPVSPASSGPAGRRGFSKQSGGPFARFDSRRITIFKPGTNFRAEVLAPPTNTFISVDLRDVDFVRSPVDVSRSGAAKRRRRSRERGTSAAGRDAIAARRAAPHPIFSFGHGCSPLPDRALGMGASRNGGITVRSAGEERTL